MIRLAMIGELQMNGVHVHDGVNSVEVRAKHSVQLNMLSEVRTNNANFI